MKYILKTISLATFLLVSCSQTDEIINANEIAETTPIVNLNKILFSAETNDISHLYIMNIDGTNETQITNFTNGTNPIWTGDASWSPDGKKIIFISNKDSDVDNGNTIYIINSDGTNLTRINHTTKNEGQPKISPDGTKILFTAEINNLDNLYTMNIDGTNEKQITILIPGNNTVEAADASWSPDGKKIIFTSSYYESTLGNGNSIYTINPDGTNLNRINAITGYKSNPEISPDGTKILFSSEANDISHLYTMNIDGTNETQITNFTNGTNPIWTGNASWSPDGKKIIFKSEHESQTDNGSSIYIINSDGTNLIRISHKTQAEEYNPTWK